MYKTLNTITLSVVPKEDFNFYSTYLFIYFGRVLVLLPKVWVSGTSCMSEYILMSVRPLSLDSLALLGSVIQKNLFYAS